MDVVGFFRKIISALEDPKVHLAYYASTFFFVIAIRNLLEAFSTKNTLRNNYFSYELMVNPNIPMFSQHGSYYLFYFTIALLVTLFLFFFLRENPRKILRIVLSAFIVLPVVPVVDIIATSGEGATLEFIYPHNGPSELLYRYLTFFFMPSQYADLTMGHRVELGLIVLAIFIYVKLKTNNLIKAVFASLVVYTLIFFHLATPAILDLLPLGDKKILHSFDFIVAVYLLYATLLFAIFLWVSEPRILLSIFRGLSIPRLLHFESMFVLGLILGGFNLFNTDLTTFFHLILLSFSIGAAWSFSVVINDVVDVRIDSVSNREKPLIAAIISQREYLTAGYIVVILAAIYSLAVNFFSFFMIMCFVGGYFVYSAPPLRLKRITYFSKLLISSNSLVLMMLGFAFAGKSLLDFPFIVTLFFLTFVTAAVNFIDLKDYLGDKKAGIVTLPVLLGLERSKFVIGLFFICAYIASTVVFAVLIGHFQVLLTASLVIFGIFHYHLIMKRDYREWRVFSAYYLSVAAAGLFLYTGL